MAVDSGEIKIRYSLKQGKREALTNETAHIFLITHWKTYLVLVPIFIIATFYFSIFFILLLFVGVALVSLYWLIRLIFNEISIRKNWERKNNRNLKSKSENFLLNDSSDLPDIKEVRNDS